MIYCLLFINTHTQTSSGLNPIKKACHNIHLQQGCIAHHFNFTSVSNWLHWSVQLCQHSSSPFPLDHSQPTSLFPHLLHKRPQEIHVTQNAFELLCRVSVQKLARDVVRNVTLPLVSLVNAANRVHVVNELVL
ncbi:hypothetical protein TRVL_07231 [Trypanosoma vivax]|nr:hypothetical protein TRVL_07231 [Trypanosoma vivax]